MLRSDRKNVINRTFFALLPVQILSALVLTLNSLFDGIIIGNYLGASHLAALGYVAPLISVIGMLDAMVSSGAQILCGRYMGKGDAHGVWHTFSTSVVLCSICGIVLTALCLGAPRFLAHLLGASDSAMDMTVQYIRGMGIGCLFMVFSGTANAFLQLEGGAGITFLSTAVMMVVKLGMDLFDALVWHQGMLGIGIATAAGYFAAFALNAGWLFLGRSSMHLSLKNVRAGVALEIVRLGLPASVTFLGLAFRGWLINRQLTRIGGAVAISAHAIASNMVNIVAAMMTGVGSSISLVSSVLVGSQDRSALRKLTSTALKVSTVLTLAVYAAVFAFAPAFVSQFGASEQEAPLAILAVRICCFYLPFNPYPVIHSSIQKSFGYFREETVFTLVDLCVYPLIPLLILSRFLGLPGLLLYGPLPTILNIPTRYIYTWIRSGRRPARLGEWIYVPENFGIRQESRMSITVKTPEDVTAVARDVQSFCRKRGMDSRSSYFCALCLEELASNIVLHGFTKDKKKHSVDILLGCENGQASVLIRDDCVPFNPMERLAMNTEESGDPSKNMGIRIVSGLAEEMNYSCALGMNLMSFRI